MQRLNLIKTTEFRVLVGVALGLTAVYVLLFFSTLAAEGLGGFFLLVEYTFWVGVAGVILVIAAFFFGWLPYHEWWMVSASRRRPCRRRSLDCTRRRCGGRQISSLSMYKRLLYTSAFLLVLAMLANWTMPDNVGIDARSSPLSSAPLPPWPYPSCSSSFTTRRSSRSGQRRALASPSRRKRRTSNTPAHRLHRHLRDVKASDFEP